EIKEKLYGPRRLLPFHFRWIGDQMVVLGDPYNEALLAGSIVKKVDGVPSAAILESLLPMAHADGSNDDKRRALMSVPGTGTWPMFDLYYDLIFKLGNTVTIEATSPAGESAEFLLPTVDIEARRANGLLTLKPDPMAPVWTSSTANEGKTRIITMPTWATYKTKWDWEGWLRGQLGEILSDGTTGLVIDLRGNEGGFNIGEGMLPAFIQEPLTVPKNQELVRFASAPEDMRPLLNTWNKSFFEIGKGGKRVNDRFIELNPYREVTIQPMPQTFGGKVVVLIDADNSSATFSFARQLRAAGVARLIGEPTGGNRRGINGGAYFFTRLPESGIEYDIPLIGYYPQGEEPDAGLVPDEIITRTAQDIASGRDPVMMRALEVLG
ncbi:MAG: S41 family peptidase, partial [Pseudomonadota bacterium]